ncbi:MAG: imidazolonepropionase [Actinomycetota bacterium]|nr:imidazolonepropionase [Actinomycetota bacterium]
MASLGINNVRCVSFSGSGPLRGDIEEQMQVVDGISLRCEDGVIVSLGEPAPADVEVDGSGCTVVAGFVDPHTHLPFYGWRADEDAARLSGVRYESLHLEEGGIYRSARMLAEASDDEVLRFSGGLARSMLAHGTTTFETKSGYGLSVEAELRQLRLASALGMRVPQTVVTTCLAAHAVPHAKSAGEWVGEAAEELLPAAAREGLASMCDIYVESIAFALEHAARLSDTAERLGLDMRIHADQLEDGQAGAFAARWGFRSADHLNHTSRDAAGDLAASDTAAVLLPGATFTLRQNQKPPARDLIEKGAIVALGSDLNPGTSPILSMPFVMALACRLYGLRPWEALAAATVNGAYVLGLEGRVGRLHPGYRADLVLLDVPAFEEVTYRPDENPVALVICGGEVSHVADSARSRIAGRVVG